MELGQIVLEPSVSLSVIIPQILHIYSSSHLGINCGPTRDRSSTETCLTPPQEKQYKKYSYNIYFILHLCILICLLRLYCNKSNNFTCLFFFKCCSDWFTLSSHTAPNHGMETMLVHGLPYNFCAAQKIVNSVICCIISRVVTSDWRLYCMFFIFALFAGN